MGDETDCKPSARPLYGWEAAEARRVFGDRLRYEDIRIHECTNWTNLIDRVGRRLRGMPPPKNHNALTLGNHCYFPVKLLDNPVPANHPEFYKLGWLIHELTHAWQYQQMGWSYLTQALLTQFREKGLAYDFGQADGLKKVRKDGGGLKKFNLEQQGDIARSYYDRLCRGEDVTDWQPYIEEIRKAA